MLSQTNPAVPEAVELLGDFHPLMAQLGSMEGLVTLSAVSRSLRLRQVDSVKTLQLFLEAYQTHILIPFELPAIQRAFLHATRYEPRELIAYDQQIATEPLWRELASASRRVGQSHLKRLRPLRDVRLVQRYLRAVEEGRAHGWHTLVFGITLSIYSLPVRQGLLCYERQVLRGFMRSAAPRLRLSDNDCEVMLSDLCADAVWHLELAIEETEGPGLRFR